MRMERVQSNGAGHGAADLAAWVSGPEGAPVIVLVHGFPDTHVVWDGVARSLEARFRVVRYDVRCSGASSVESGRGDDAFVLEALAEDLASIARHFGRGRPVHVVGHDWGAIQSWEPVSAPSTRSLFASLSVISGPSLDHLGHWLRAHARSFDRPGEKLRQCVASLYVALFQFRAAAHVVRRLLPRQAVALGIVEGDVPSTLGDEAARALVLYRANMRQRLFSPRDRPIDVPVLQLVVRDDPHVTPMLAEAADPWVRSLERVMIDGGHWVVRAYPARVAEPLAAFVDRVEATG